MLSPVTQSGSTSPQIPLTLLRQSSFGWPCAETDDLEVLAPANRTATEALPSQVSMTFLRRVATDARLRAELADDPAATLWRFGIHVAPEQIPQAVRLPSREVLDGALRVYATAEDENSSVRWVGFLGGLLDDLFGNDGD